MAASIERQVLEEAADWLLRLQDGELSEDERTALEGWCQRSQQHRRAWLRAQSLMSRLDSLPASVARATLDRPDNPARREALGKLVLVLAAVPVAWSAWHVAGKYPGAADYATAVGQQRRLTLADGSELILNTDTEVDVDFSPEVRQIRLRKGEVWVQTANTDDPRPFIVTTYQAQLQALGTQFSVRQDLQNARVLVYDGAVRVTPKDRESEARVIDAGFAAQFNDYRVESPTVLSHDKASWTSGMLLADALPLSVFATEIDRYRRGRLRVDPEISQLRVSGAYPLTDSDKALAMLADTYSLSVNSTLLGLWTTISR